MPQAHDTLQLLIPNRDRVKIAGVNLKKEFDAEPAAKGGAEMRRMLIASVAITILLIFCTFDDLLSLHDIKADYVSKSVLTYLRVETTEALPQWTDTRLEWASVSISYALRSVLILSNLGILLLLMKRLPQANGHASAKR